jgi:hypothetical protein
MRNAKDVTSQCAVGVRRSLLVVMTFTFAESAITTAKTVTTAEVTMVLYVGSKCEE